MFRHRRRSALQCVGCGYENQEHTKSSRAVDAILLVKLNPRIDRVWHGRRQPDGRAVCSTEFFVLTATGAVRAKLELLLFALATFRQQFEELSTGTTSSHHGSSVDSISRASCRVLASGDSSSTFEDRVRAPRFAASTANDDASPNPRCLRDSLLPEARDRESCVTSALTRCSH